MAMNDSKTLSSPLLVKKEININTNPRIETIAYQSALRGTSAPDVPDSTSWTWVHRAQALKALIEQESLIQQENNLDIDKLDHVLTSILDLEQGRPIGQRLDLDEIIFMALAMLNKSFFGDRLEMILGEIAETKGISDLKQRIRNEMVEETETHKLTPEPCEVIVSQGSYEEIMEIEATRITKSAFQGHTDEVNSVVVSPDNKFIISGSSDNSIKVWNILDLKEEFTLLGHTGHVKSVCSSSDGRFIISGSEDKTIKIWNVQEQRAEFTLIGHSDSVNSVAVSVDNKFIVSGSSDNTVRIWNMQGRREECILIGHTERVSSVAVSADTRFIVTGSIDKTIKIWDVQGRREDFTLSGHMRGVLSVDISPNGEFIVSGSDDNTIKIWSMLERKEVFTLSGHNNHVNSVKVTDDSKFIVSGSYGEIITWNVQEQKREGQPIDIIGNINSVATSKDCKLIVGGSSEKIIRIMSATYLRKECVLVGHTRSTGSVVISLDNRFVISGSDDRTVRIWNIQEKREECILMGQNSGVNSLTLSPDGRFLLSNLFRRDLRLWNFHERKEEFTLGDHEKKHHSSVIVSPDSKFLVIGLEDGMIKVWSIVEQREECTLSGHTDRVNSVAVTPDSRYIVSGSTDNTIKIWNLQSLREECTLTGHTNSVKSVIISPNGKVIISISQDKTIRIWSLSARREEFVFTEGHDARTIVSPDARYIISLLKDNSIKLWNIQERRQDCILTGHTSYIFSVAVSLDGRLLVSGSGDNIYGTGESAIRVWNILEKREELVCTWSGHRYCAFAVAVSPDCNFVACGLGDGTIRVFNIREQKEKFNLLKQNILVQSVVLCPDNRFIIRAINGGKITIWSVQERREESIAFKDNFAVSPDGRFIASGSDQFLIIWNVQESREECTMIGHKSHISSVAVSPDSRFIVTGSFDKTIKIWNIQERREECTLNGHEDFVVGVAVSPDGRFIISSAQDKSIRIWNFQEQKEECILRVSSYYRSITMSVDGRFIIAGSGENALLFNMLEPKEEFALNHGHKISKFIISTDSSFLIIKSLSNKVKFFNLQTRQYEKFSIKSHSNLLQYIPAMSSTANNLRVCKLYVTSDFIVLASALGICDLIRIVDGNLQFTYDIGQALSKDAFTDCNFEYYASAIDSTSISPLVADVSHGILRFTLAHYYSYLGLKGNLQKLVDNTNFCINVDAFSKSPFFYAISKKRQDCVDVLLDCLELMRVQNPKNYEMSIFAVRNDFILLINNSPRQLHTLLNNLITTSNQAYAKILNELPIFQVGFTPRPKIEDFSDKVSDEIPVILQSSKFQLVGEIGCSHNEALLDAIINCKNSQALRCPIVYYIVELQFNAIKAWVISYTILLCANIVLLMLLIGLKSFDWYLVVPFFLVNFSLLVFELVQMVTNASQYLQDPWNFLDISRNLASVVWIILELYSFSSLYFTWIVALINLLRGITAFHLFDGTRFYVDLIFTSLSDIKYFFLMFSYSTFTFGCLLMISREQGLSFDGIWGDSYNLNFGNYEGTDTGVYFMQYIVYFGATIINVVLMLNLLISILGDSYERFQLDQGIVDIKEKARISMEYQSMMFWTKKESELKCIRLCKSAFQDEENQDWEGRIRFLDKKLDKSIKELTDSNQFFGKAIKEISTSIEIKMKASIDSLDSNMQSTVESKMKMLETQMVEGNQSLNAKIKESNDLTNSKIQEMNQKLEAILTILSK